MFAFMYVSKYVCMSKANLRKIERLNILPVCCRNHRHPAAEGFKPAPSGENMRNKVREG